MGSSIRVWKGWRMVRERGEVGCGRGREVRKGVGER